MSRIAINDLMENEFAKLSDLDLETVKGGYWDPLEFIATARWFFDNFDTVVGYWEAGSGWIVGIR